MELKSFGELADLYTDRAGSALFPRITKINRELQAEKEAAKEQPGALREGPAPERQEEDPDLEQNLNINELINSGQPGGPRL